MCAGKASGFMPLLLLGQSDLLEHWLTLTSAGAGLWRHLANKHKYSVEGGHMFFCSSVDTGVMLMILITGL